MDHALFFSGATLIEIGVHSDVLFAFKKYYLRK